MRRKCLDSCVLINHWQRCSGGSVAGWSPAEAATWAMKLIDMRGTRAIVTPVYLEMVAGTRNKHELMLTRQFLKQFKLVDDGNVVPEDWTEARRLAERIPRNGRRREVCDCLIRAICNRLGYDVDTLDEGFPS
jgi:predicted nucleic acid-binding protein